MKIAIFGKMRSGKDTVGKILIEEHNFKQFAFGDGIGEIIVKYFPEAWNNGKPRKHYQHIGQELRKLNPDVWINYLLRKVNHYELQVRADNIGTKNQARRYAHVVITDGRQQNEAVKLKEEGFVIIKVTAPEEQRIQRIKESGDVFNPEHLQHETELQVDMIEPDIEIVNDGTLEELMVKVQKVLQGGVLNGNN